MALCECVHQSVLVSALRMYDKNTTAHCVVASVIDTLYLSREHFDITKVGCDTDEF